MVGITHYKLAVLIINQLKGVQLNDKVIGFVETIKLNVMMFKKG